MHFLKLLIISALGIGLVLAAGYFGGNYARLYWQAGELKADLQRVRTLHAQSDYASECRVVERDEEDEERKEKPVLGSQLRFVNERDYVLEIVCVSSLRGPVLVAKGSLVWGVEKEDGYSGMFFRAANYQTQVGAGLVLRSGPFRRAVVYDGERFSVRGVDTVDVVEPGNNQAMAACKGWGGVCCDGLTASGVGGEYRDKVSDCGGRCFETCVRRPVLLFFSAEPEIHQQARVLELRGQSVQVVFTYSIQAVDGEIDEVTISFGDGDSFVGHNAIDSVAHTFECGEGLCSYKVLVSAVDKNGLALVESNTQRITVVQAAQ